MLSRGARVGGKTSNEDWADATNGWGWVSLIGWWLAVSVSTLIVGALLALLAPAALYAAERAVRGSAPRSRGVVIAIGVPVLAVLALATLVGIPFGVALLLAALRCCSSRDERLIAGSGCCATARRRHGLRCWRAGESCACWP